MTVPATETRCPFCTKLQGLSFVNATVGATAMASGYQYYYEPTAVAGAVTVFPSTTTATIPCSLFQFDWCTCVNVAK